MPKLHTRQKRKLWMKSIRGRKRAKRPKTFRTEEGAKRYAEAKGIKDYRLVDLKGASPKKHKFRVVSG